LLLSKRAAFSPESQFADRAGSRAAGSAQPVAKRDLGSFASEKDMKYPSLFIPLQLGQHILRNRIVLPPLTRQRAAQPGDIPTALSALYYRQRAGAGFMISEGAQIEPRGQGYAWTPGIYSDEQVEGWARVTDAIHGEGGVIFAQLWHVGRVSHTALQPRGAAPVAPSSIAAQKVKAFIETGSGTGTLVEPSVPRELSVAEIRELSASTQRQRRTRCARASMASRFTRPMATS
jgi:2,4-dienoyl-CoA reductase-like NADH-dependent reductase (Old Yellow Enzyme family)